MIVLWDEGETRLRATSGAERAVLERVVDALTAELRRRLGGRFTATELALLYLEGTDWWLDVAMHAAPNSPEAWEGSIVVGAAFARYLRRAADYGGGRRIAGGDDES